MLEADEKATFHEGLRFANLQTTDRWDIVVRYKKDGEIFCVVSGPDEAEARRRADIICHEVYG